MLPPLLAAVTMVAPARANWRKADRSSAHIAPLPSVERRAVVQVYTARALSWRGWFAGHSWIAI